MKETVSKTFREIYGAADDVRSYFAPGRVNLIGEHTDYNGGHVFPCALSYGTYAAAARRNDRKLRFYSVNFPGNAGLSSSAALEVLTGIMLRDMFGFDISNQEIALLGQKAENEYCGLNCGIMDQFASAMGRKDHAIFLDTSDLSFQYVPFVLQDEVLIITNTNKKHSLKDSAYNDRRRECGEALEALRKFTDAEALCDLSPEDFEGNKDAIKDPVCPRRARHAVYENRRTIEGVRALEAGDLEEFGRLMNASHVSLRDDYEVSCRELDILAETAWEIPGVLGSRMTGGGFGGCTVSIVKKEAADEFCRVVGETYREKAGFDCTFYVVSPGGGPEVF